MMDIVERLNDSLSAGYSELRKEAAVEITRLRAKIKAMEQQGPVGKFIQHPSHGMGGEREAALMAKLEASESIKASYKNAFEISENTIRNLTEKVIPNIRKKLEAAEKERDDLRAKIDEMEKQEPAGWIGLGPRDGRIEFSTHRPAPSIMRDFNVKPLYLAPGAQGEEK